MRGYDYASPDPFTIMLPFILLLVAIVMLAAWLVAISKLVEVYKQKQPSGEEKATGILWFIGIFASPVVLGLYVCALADRSDAPMASEADKNQLPSL